MNNFQIAAEKVEIAGKFNAPHVAEMAAEDFKLYGEWDVITGRAVGDKKRVALGQALLDLNEKIYGGKNK